MSEPFDVPRVLVVDDEPFFLNVLQRQIERCGAHIVATCTQAQEALDFLSAPDTGIDVVFCDLQMPDIDGIQFVRALARARFGGALVLVSGESERILQTAERLADAHGLRVLGALRKPISPEALAAVFAKLTLQASPLPRPRRKLYQPEDLRRALAGKQLVNYYQPKVELATGAVRGMETLVRWRHPDDGLVPPDQFVGLAENCGLIDDLTAGVLDDALRQARLWRDDGQSLHVAVNISMDNLAALDFPDFVARTAGSFEVPLSSLVLEVTESRLMKDRRMPLDVLTRLRLKQVALSIDDFGTGHSSLANLRDIPFNELKIDRGFVHGAARDAALRAIVEASLEMARHLGMVAVGEGVENSEDWHYLRAAGCDLAQGYYIGRPMPASEIADWMAAWDGRRAALAPRTSVAAWPAAAEPAPAANAPAVSRRNVGTE